MFLLDTNVVSEARRTQGEPRVKGWLQAAPSRDLHLSVIAVGEIRRGVERLRPTDPAQAMVLDRWLRTLTERFADRILPVDARVADVWGRLGAVRPVPVEDGLMAATAAVHGLTFVTRNVRDVAGLGVDTLDPWTA